MAVLQTGVWRVRPGKTQEFLVNVASARQSGRFGRPNRDRVVDRCAHRLGLIWPTPL